MPDSATIAPRLRLRHICKRFGATVALDGVDLGVAPGEVHAVIGENGAGKSTLMKVLSGAHQPDAGEMALDGAPLQVVNPRDALDAGIAMIYQELNLAPDLSVMENISLGREPHRAGWIDRPTQRRIARDALGRLHRADVPLDALVRDLSLAQRQMVEIARAVRRPPEDATPLRLLILDEPTSSLTQVDVENLFEIIGRIKQEGVSVLYISHFLEECVRVADRFTVLRDGRTVGGGRMDQTPLDEVIHMMVGRDVSELYPSFTHEPGEPVLELDNVAGVIRPRNVSLTLRRGEIFGLAGLVGGGRTETVRAVFGLDRLKEGRVVVHGQETRRRVPAVSWGREDMGIVSEDRKNEGLLLNRSLEENLTVTRSRPYRRGGLLRPRRMRQAAREWMRRLDVRAAGPDQIVGELSGGNQQKIAFGRLLHHDCRILLLDEPTRGIDIGSKATIYRCIGELAASGKAILLVSSYLPELLGICDTIGVVSRGRLVAVKPRGEWDMHSLLAAAVGHGDVTSPPSRSSNE